MFDMSWGEVMLIGGVALVVIGPKDLPRALRTVGQVTGKLKRMAGEFQSQFNEAMREAELDEVRREVEGVNRSVSTFNPVQTIRNELKGAVDSAGTKPSDAELAAATAQLQAETDAAGAAATTPASSEAAPPVDAPSEAPEAAQEEAHTGPEAPVRAEPRPSIDGAPLVSPEPVAGVEPAAAPAAPESAPSIPHPESAAAAPSETDRRT